MDSKKILTLNEGYDAVFDFLNKYCNRVDTADIDSLVGSMLLFDDGSSIDAAAQEDWKDSVWKILNQKQPVCPMINEDQSIAHHFPDVTSTKINTATLTAAEKILTFDEAYDAMIDFLEGYCTRTNSDETRSLIDGMLLLTGETSVNPIALEEWKKSVDKILKQNPRVRPVFPGFNWR